MGDRKIFISKRCDHCVRLIVGLSKHDLLRHFNVTNIDNETCPSFITSVPALFHNGKIISGEPLFNYMNDFASKIMKVADKKTAEPAEKELDAWCPGGACALGFSEITESNDNFKDTFHEDTGGFSALDSVDSVDSGPNASPQSNTEDSGGSKRVEDFNKQYEEFMNNRK